MALSDEQRRKLNEKAAARSQEQSNYRPPFETQHNSQKVPVSQQDWFVILMGLFYRGFM